jgi:hypothetical protein
VVAEYRWSPNSSIEQVYKVIRGRYPASPSDDPVKPSVQNQDQLPLAYIRVRPVTVIGGVRRVNISQTDILHVPKSSDLPADDVSALKPEIDPTNRLRIYVHPGVFLRGRGRQGKKVPCFFFGEYGGILPAFGAFTGSAILRARNGDRVFVVAGEEVLEV